MTPEEIQRAIELINNRIDSLYINVAIMALAVIVGTAAGWLRRN